MKIFVITGQTATGKTKFALELAKKNNGELINCDSRQIYKKIDIITGKDLNKNAVFKIQHSLNNFDIGYYQISTISNHSQLFSTKLWLYDIADPKQYFSSYDWVKCAREVIDEIIKRQKTPIIVGGSYFYLKHLLYGISTENIPPDWQLRKQLNNQPVIQLQQTLKKLDVQSFKRLNQSDKNNPRRLIRQIEIAAYRQKKGKKATFNLTPAEKIGLKFTLIGLKHKTKEKLIKAITKRVEERLKNGAVEEMRQLLKKGYQETDPGLKTIGCQQLIAYLKGKLTKEETINQWITAETQYAKRQYTFMKKEKKIKWIKV